MPKPFEPYTYEADDVRITVTRHGAPCEAWLSELTSVSDDDVESLQPVTRAVSRILLDADRRWFRRAGGWSRIQGAF